MNKMKYAVEQRIRLLDFLLAQYGTVNRSALEDYFGISSPQASLDIQTYIELAPDNIVYDKHRKTYVCTEQFKRVWS